jgi:uncharacterized protein (DUF1697 family)
MRYVALLRGINIGSAKRVAMADLRALVEGMGYGEVHTLLNSGNVVFTGPKEPPAKVADRISEALDAKLGVAVRVMALTAAELAGIIDANPLLDVADDHSRLFVGVLAGAADTVRLADIVKADWGAERIALGAWPSAAASRAVYMWMPRGVIESRLNPAVAKALADRVTARNWATMLKLRAMTEDA